MERHAYVATEAGEAATLYIDVRGGRMTVETESILTPNDIRAIHAYLPTGTVKHGAPVHILDRNEARVAEARVYPGESVCDCVAFYYEGV